MQAEDNLIESPTPTSRILLPMATIFMYSYFIVQSMSLAVLILLLVFVQAEGRPIEYLDGSVPATAYGNLSGITA